MSGKPLSLYFHIPFCTRKCPYCHFYVIPNKKEHRDLLLEALLLELNTLNIQNHDVVSIYFGGGTPTLFGIEPIDTVLKAVKQKCSVIPDCEVTIEANPEDVTEELMKGYKQAGINRVSMGVQSLQDPSLLVLGRGHSANKALSAIYTTHEAGFKNISIDLMYELPDQTLADFQRTLAQLNPLPITHLSLYNLTIEPHTSFAKKKLSLPPQETNLAMLKEAVDHLESIGLKRYEISAFAKPGYTSRHNTGYWTARPFFGLGPSAFSYIDGARYRNVCNLNHYASALKDQKSPVDFHEALPYPANAHELLAVRLRLLEGVCLHDFDLPKQTQETLSRLEEDGYLVQEGDRIKLSEKGLLFYDTVASEII